MPVGEHESRQSLLSLIGQRCLAKLLPFFGKEEIAMQKYACLSDMKSLRYLTCAIFLFSGVAFAQSSGNFSYATTGENFVGCTLNTNGNITGGFQCQQSCTLNADGTSSCTTASGECMGNAVAGIKTSSGNGNVFVVRPSAVVGLLTDVTVSSNQRGSAAGVTSSALAGV